MLPAPDIPAEAKAGYYETLGQGHVVATLGEILRNQLVAPAAAAAAGLSERERSGTKLQVQVVPGTSLIRLTVSADSPLVAERWADAVAATGVSAAAPFSRPYVVSPVGSARGTATRAGASPATLLALVAVLAAASALAVQQLTYQARRWAALLRAATTPARRSADQDVDAASAGGGHRPGFRQLRRSRSGE